MRLCHQLDGLRRGEYLEEIVNSDPIDICIGVGGYPEKHVEAPNLKTDLEYLKRKVEAGADYVVAQMFFDNAVFFRFVEGCRGIGLTVPIIPGIKVLNSVRQLTSLPKNFQVNLPEDLVDEITANPDHVKEIGLMWAVRQCEELIAAEAPCIHFYILTDASAVIEVIRALG